MRKILGLLVALCAAGLAACGDKGSDLVGTWTIDHDAVVDRNRDQFPGVDMANPEAVKQLKEGLRKSVQASINLRADGTYVGTSQEEEGTSTATGKWSVSGATVTFTPGTKDSKPVQGEDAIVWTLTLKDGKLAGQKGGKGPILVLKRA